MTKFILTGGNDRVRPGFGLRLAEELHKTHSKLRIVSCFWAAPRQQWQTMSQNWRQWFEQNMGSLDGYDYARPGVFTEQIEKCNVIYLHGGPNEALFDAMHVYDDLRAFFAGKAVVGSSAGANLLSKNYWGSSRQVARKGRGVLDVNIMCHYGSPDHKIKRSLADWQNEEKEFRKFIGSEIEKVWHIPEGKFITFEVDG